MMNPLKLKTLKDYADDCNRLNVKYTLYICTKDRESKDVEKDLLNKFINDTMRFICETFGGCNLRKGKGIFYNSQNQKIIEENNYIISVNCTEEQSAKHEHDLIRLQEENCLLLNQHSATIEKNNEMFFICAPPDIEEEEEEEEEEKEKQIITDMSYKEDFKSLNELNEYIENHFLYSALPMYEHNHEKERTPLIGDIIFKYHKYSSYTYDCFYQIVKITKCFIFYSPLYPYEKLTYNNYQDLGQSERLYHYKYGEYDKKTVLKCKKTANFYILHNNYTNNHGFLYLTRFRH